MLKLSPCPPSPHFCTRLNFFFNPASNSKASLSLLHRYAVYKVPRFLLYFPCEMRSVAAPLMPQSVTSKMIWSSSFFRFDMSQLASQLKEKPRGRGRRMDYWMIAECLVTGTSQRAIIRGVMRQLPQFQRNSIGKKIFEFFNNSKFSNCYKN